MATASRAQGTESALRLLKTFHNETSYEPTCEGSCRQRLTNLYALVARSALLRNDGQIWERIRFLASRSVNGGIGKDC